MSCSAVAERRVRSTGIGVVVCKLVGGKRKGYWTGTEFWASDFEILLCRQLLCFSLFAPS
jgi:hypothetical protein